MDIEEFRIQGKQMIDFICDYTNNLETYSVFPPVQPGFLRAQLPREAPQQPEDWNSIMSDVQHKILPGVTHWQHSAFHAYFPYGASFPSLLGEILADAIGSNSFSWTSCPSSTELELVVTDWLAKAMDLPAHFQSCSRGGGVLTTSASEAILNCMLAARERGLRLLRERNGGGSSDRGEPDAHYLPLLVAYCSEESHSSVEKAAKICLVRLRTLPTNSVCALTGDTLQRAMLEDCAAGFLPVFVSVTLGSTSTAAFDEIRSIGPVCEKFGAWLHADAAYAGSSFICPEMRVHQRGLEYADSFNVNPYKWLLTGADCAALWVRDKAAYCSGLIVDPLYLEAGNTDLSMDLRHWGIPLTRKFRSLKLWFVLRRYGVEGLRKYQRNHMALAKYLESLVREDGRFEMVGEVRTGLVCFRLLADDSLNRQLLVAINSARNIYITPTTVKGRYVLRFCVNHEHANISHIERAWNEISISASKVLCCGPPVPESKSRFWKSFSLPRSISLDYQYLSNITLSFTSKQRKDSVVKKAMVT